MARRKGWGRQHFGRSDELELLDIIEVARHRAIKMAMSVGYGEDRWNKAHTLMTAIDVLAEEFTGRRDHFHDKGSSGVSFVPGNARIALHLSRPITNALDRFIDEQTGEDRMMREAAVEALVVDQLTALGLLEFDEPPHERREDAN